MIITIEMKRLHRYYDPFGVYDSNQSKWNNSDQIGSLRQDEDLCRFYPVGNDHQCSDARQHSHLSDSRHTLCHNGASAKPIANNILFFHNPF